MTEFYSDGFTSNRCVVVGHNVDHKELIQFSECLNLLSNDISPGNARYYGGEIRKNKNSHFAHVAIATEGVGLVFFKY